jgi:hypothetical protein
MNKKQIMSIGATSTDMSRDIITDDNTHTTMTIINEVKDKK